MSRAPQPERDIHSSSSSSSRTVLLFSNIEFQQLHILEGTLPGGVGPVHHVVLEHLGKPEAGELAGHERLAPAHGDGAEREARRQAVALAVHAVLQPEPGQLLQAHLQQGVHSTRMCNATILRGYL